MSLEQTIAKLKSRKRVKVQKEKDPIYNRILMAHDMSGAFLNELRQLEELADIRSIHTPKKGIDLKVEVEKSLPANSVIFMRDEDPVAAWIGGRIKLITKKKK